MRCPIVVTFPLLLHLCLTRHIKTICPRMVLELWLPCCIVLYNPSFLVQLLCETETDVVKLTTHSPSYEGTAKSFRTESIMKYTLTFGIARWEATQRVMATYLTRLTHKIRIQLHVVAESCTTCSSYSRRPVRELLDTPSYSSEVKECVKLYPHCPNTSSWCGA
jgi:hypothetical protein